MCYNEKMKHIYDLIIIGSGPSGLYAGYLGRLHNLDILILESSNDYGGQLNLFLDKPIYDLPGLTNINGSYLKTKLKKQLDSKGKKYISLNQKVIKIEGDVGSFIVKTKSKSFETRTIIIADGGGVFEPVRLPIENEEKYDNIFYSIKNSKKFIEKKLLIFGGGDSALDWSNYFSKMGSEVSLIHRREKFRGQEKSLEEIKNKVKIYAPYKIDKIIHENDKYFAYISNLRSNETQKLNYDFALVFYGQKKILVNKDDFAVDYNTQGYKVESNMQTSRKGIFSIGNISNYKGKIKLLITGFGEAATAIGSVIEILKPGKKLSYYVKKKED